MSDMGDDFRAMKAASVEHKAKNMKMNLKCQ